MKVVVIGCTHAGTAAIMNLTKLHPDAKITVYEKNDTISFLSCGIALYVGGVIQDPKGLFYCSPEKLTSLGVQTKMRHEVTDADLDEKTLKVRNLDTGIEFEDTFDKLIITTGSWPIVPKLPGIDLGNILMSKSYDHSKEIVEKTKTAQRILVAGAGYIGVELAEAFKANGKTVTLLDSQERILKKYLDKEFTDMIQKELQDNSIQLVLGECITGFEGQNGKVTKVLTDNGVYETDLVILCIGFRPNTGLFKERKNCWSEQSVQMDEMAVSHYRAIRVSLVPCQGFA